MRSPAGPRGRDALAQRLETVLALDPAANAVEYAGEWWTWGRIAEVAYAVAARVPGPGAPCGVLLRNTPLHLATFLGVLLAEGCVVTANPGLGERTRTDLDDLDLALLAGTPDDLAEHGRHSRAQSRLVIVEPLGHRETEPWRGVTHPGVAVLMLTSGTTGIPKRVPLAAEALLRAAGGSGAEQPRLRTGVAVVNSPLVHVGGVFRVLQCLLSGRPFAMLPRFEVHAWADAVRRHRPATASLVPTALRMVLDSDLTREDLSSLRTVTSGTAPLDPDDADAFRKRFGVPVLTSYAATEFAGGVAGWNLSDFERYGTEKRGSVGRANPGCGLRVVAEDGTEQAPGEPGLLEVRPEQLGPGIDWIRTTDLARIDADGFLWILGRSDQTIIRGGFKVQPDTVRAVLEQHPAVRGASVLGVPDQRLGEVPVALVELREDATATAADVLDASAPQLARYEIPTRVVVVATLPRTASGKVDLSAARALLDGAHS